MLEHIANIFPAGEPLLLVLAGISIFLVAGGVALFVWNVQTAKRLRIIFSGKDAQDLEEVLAAYIKKVRVIDARLAEIEKRGEETRHIADASIQKYSVVRFNPFRGTGGNQSFSAAFLDGKNNGVILTSLFVRENARLYAKPIIEGKSPFQLTREEERAISQAMDKKKLSKK